MIVSSYRRQSTPVAAHFSLYPRRTVAVQRLLIFIAGTNSLSKYLRSKSHPQLRIFTGFPASSKMTNPPRLFAECRLLVLLALLFNGFLSSYAALSWPESEFDRKIHEIHVETGKPMQLNCTVPLGNGIYTKPVEKVLLNVYHKRNLKPDSNHPIYAVDRRINNTHNNIIARVGTWLDPNLIQYVPTPTFNRQTVRTVHVRKMRDGHSFVKNATIPSLWDALVTFELEAPGVVDSGTYFGMEVRLPPLVLAAQQCFFYVKTYECPTNMRLEFIDEKKSPKLTTECYYNTFQPSEDDSAALGAAASILADKSKVTARNKQNNSVIVAHRRVEQLHGRPDDRAEVPAAAGLRKRHELSYMFDLGAENSTQDEYDVVEDCTLFVDRIRDGLVD